MSWVAVGTSVGTAAFKFFQGRSQSRKADRIRREAYNPGFERNQGLIDTENTLRDYYTNYQMPGYGQAVQDVNMAANTAFNQGVQGASSSADVLDLATRVQYGRQQGLNQVALSSAQGREQALMNYLQAQNAVGQDSVRVNMLENQRYDQQMAEAAALQQAGVTNQYGAINELGAGLTQVANSYFSPQWTSDYQGRMIEGDSRFNKWLQNRRRTSELNRMNQIGRAESVGVTQTSYGF